MKSIYLKRILSASLAAVMAVTMVGCGCGKKKDNAADEQASHDASAYVYKDNPIDLGQDVDLTSVSCIGKYGERVYCIVRADGKIIEEWGA